MKVRHLVYFLNPTKLDLDRLKAHQANPGVVVELCSLHDGSAFDHQVAMFLLDDLVSPLEQYFVGEELRPLAKKYHRSVLLDDSPTATDELLHLFSTKPGH